MNDEALAALIARTVACTTTLAAQAHRGIAAVDETRTRIDSLIRALSTAARDSHQMLSVLDSTFHALEATVARERVALTQAFEIATHRADQTELEAATTLSRIEEASTALSKQHDETCRQLESEAARLEQHWQSLAETTHRQVAAAVEAHEAAVVDLAQSSARVLEQVDALASARAELLTAYDQREALLDEGLGRLEATMAALASRTLSVLNPLEDRAARTSDAVTSAVHRAFATDTVDALGAFSSSLCQALQDLEGVGRQPRAVAETDLSALTQKLRACLPALEQIIAIHRKARQMEICNEASAGPS